MIALWLCSCSYILINNKPSNNKLWVTGQENVCCRKQWQGIVSMNAVKNQL